MSKEQEAINTQIKILLDVGVLKTTNRLTYDTYVPQVHVSNLVKAMRLYSESKQQRIEELEDALNQIINAPHPYNESEAESWIITAVSIAKQSLQQSK